MVCDESRLRDHHSELLVLSTDYTEIAPFLLYSRPGTRPVGARRD
jgi:hypothetical protein